MKPERLIWTSISDNKAPFSLCSGLNSLGFSELYSEPSLTSKMELFAKIVNGGC